MWNLCSCFFSGVMINMVKHVAVDLNTGQIIFFRNLFAFGVFLPFVLWKHHHFRTKRIKVHLLRSSSGLISMMIYFYAASILNISVVTALSFTAPLFTTIFAIYFFKDRPSRHQIFALFIGFVGVMIVVQPGTAAFNPVSLIMILSGISWAVSGIVIKKLSQTEPAYVTTFYMTLFMMIFSAPIAFYEWKPITNEQYLWIFGIAIASNLLQFSLAKALSLADFSVILPFDFTRLIFTSGIAYFLFHEKMPLPALLGSVVILAAAFYSGLNERRKVRRLSGIAQINREF